MVDVIAVPSSILKLAIIIKVSSVCIQEVFEFLLLFGLLGPQTPTTCEDVSGRS